MKTNYRQLMKNIVNYKKNKNGQLIKQNKFENQRLQFSKNISRNILTEL